MPQEYPRKGRLNLGDETAAMRILVVDDDPVSAHMVSMYLKNMRFEVETASSGHECLERASRDTFALILMDCQMPDLDGFTTVQELRKRGYRSKIVALSGDTDDETIARCQQVGMDGHLGKPVMMDALKLALLRHLSDPLERVRKLADAAGNVSVTELMVGVFRESCDRVVERLRTAVGNEDRDATLALTHRLRGSAGSFGAEYFAELTVAAEKAVYDDGYPEARPRVLEVVDYWPTLRGQLEGSENRT